MFTRSFSIKRIIINNAFWRSASIIINKLVRLFVVFFVAKSLGPSGFGYYNYVLALVSVFFVFSDWGVNILMARDIHQREEDKKSVVNSALAAKLVLIFLPFLIGLAYLVFFQNAKHLLLGLIVMGMLCFNAVKEVFNNYFIAIQESFYEFVVYIVEDLILVFLIFYTIFVSSSVVGFALWYLAASIVAFFIGLVLVNSKIGISLSSVKVEEIKRVFKDGLPLSLFGVLGYIFFSTDQLFVAHYFGYVEVGYYAFAAKLILTFSIISSLLNSVLFPYIARNFSDKQKIKSLLCKVVPIYAGLGLAIILFINLFSGFIVLRFFGEQYMPSINLLNLFSWILIFVFSVSILDYVLIAYNQQKNDFILTLCAAVINLVLNFVLVPSYGSAGAIISSILSQALNFVLTLLLVCYLLKKD